MTAMLDLALQAEVGPVSLQDIAHRQGISLAYLEQLFAKLRRRGLVESSRGPGGGYRLGLQPEQLFIADIIDAVDETVDATRCGGQSNCHNQQRCLTHDLWASLSDEIRQFLSGISLAALMQRDGVQRVAARQTDPLRERTCLQLVEHSLKSEHPSLT